MNHRGRDGDDGWLEPSASRAVHCHCGSLLADRIDGPFLVIDGVEYQFRRRTDTLTCPDCRHEHPRRSLRPGLHRASVDAGLRRRREVAR